MLFSYISSLTLILIINVQMIFNLSIEIDCRYLRRKLVAKGAIFEQSLPQYLAKYWVDKSSDFCIFKASHMETWP
jgi:hypothetical protein